MSAPSQLTVTYLVYSGATPAVITTATVVIPVPAILQDSGQNTATGMSAFDALLCAVSRRKGITYVDASGIQNFIPLNQIAKIVAA